MKGERGALGLCGKGGGCDEEGWKGDVCVLFLRGLDGWMEFGHVDSSLKVVDRCT